MKPSDEEVMKMIAMHHGARMLMPVITAMTLCASDAEAQNAGQTCKPPQVIPLTTAEPAPRIVVEPPLAEPLASRGVVVIPYCTEHLRITPVFGPGALQVSPRIGHIHVTVDDAPWRWADASGTPVILQGLPPGPHKVLLELVDPNHRALDKGSVTFLVPKIAVPPAPK